MVKRGSDNGQQDQYVGLGPNVPSVVCCHCSKFLIVWPKGLHFIWSAGDTLQVLVGKSPHRGEHRLGCQEALLISEGNLTGKKGLVLPKGRRKIAGREGLAPWVAWRFG